MPRRFVPYVLIGLAGFAAGLCVATTRPVAAEPIPPRVVNLEDPPLRSLDANLWMQSAAEYRACCHQAYNLARRRLIEKLADAPAGGWARPPAVVLDLDETVLDNGAFQTRLAANKLTFDEKTWADWEANGYNQVRLVPGAKDFIDEAKRRGVAVVYITNRSDAKASRDGTRNALELLGVDVPGDDLYGLKEKSPTDKTQRRAEAERRYTVLLYVGDNLRDFHEGDFRSPLDNGRPGKGSTDAAQLRAAAAGRAAAVDRCRDLFGREWILLPNPAYGEWAKLAGRGEKDRELLR
jgi:5'-nucleotidase (lipoprotein e(P4) family)